MNQVVYGNKEMWNDMPIILKVLIISLLLAMAQMVIHMGIHIGIPKAFGTMEIRANTMIVTGKDRYGDIEYTSEGADIGVWFLSAPSLMRDLEKYKVIRLQEELDYRGKSKRVYWAPIKQKEKEKPVRVVPASEIT